MRVGVCFVLWAFATRFTPPAEGARGSKLLAWEAAAAGVSKQLADHVAQPASHPAPSVVRSFAARGGFSCAPHRQRYRRRRHQAGRPATEWTRISL